MYMLYNEHINRACLQSVQNLTRGHYWPWSLKFTQKPHWWLHCKLLQFFLSFSLLTRIDHGCISVHRVEQFTFFGTAANLHAYPHHTTFKFLHSSSSTQAAGKFLTPSTDLDRMESSLYSDNTHSRLSLYMYRKSIRHIFFLTPYFFGVLWWVS